MKFIDWQRTGKLLKRKRCDDLELRKYVCKFLSEDEDEERHFCNNKYNCAECEEMDNQISQAELGNALGVTDTIVNNWERGNTVVPIEYLLEYARICKCDFFDLIKFENE